jgi:hypothetical protein
MEWTTQQRDELIGVLSARFQQHMQRHAQIAWQEVLARLEAHPDKLRVLHEMERTGGEPDVIGRDSHTGAIVFCDCSAQSPAGRRSLCYDGAALEQRKANKPAGSAVEMAAAIGVELLNEEQYRALQQLGAFDTTTSSWVHTPAAIRRLGGALFCDRRYETVFVYHNGAESYYGARGFRGLLHV